MFSFVKVTDGVDSLVVAEVAIADIDHDCDCNLVIPGKKSIWCGSEGRLQGLGRNHVIHRAT